MILKEKIWSGRYRESYATADSSICAKKIKDKTTKKFFWLDVFLNTKIYLLLQFWIKDLNKKDFNIMQNLPDELQKYMPKDLKIEWHYLIMERIKDYNWEYSKTLKDFWTVKNNLLFNLEKKRKFTRKFNKLIKQYK